MDLFRWILLFIGAAIVLTIYLFGRWRSRDVQKPWEQVQDDSGVVLEEDERFPAIGQEPLDQELRELGSRLTVEASEVEIAVPEPLTGGTAANADPVPTAKAATAKTAFRQVEAAKPSASRTQTAEGRRKEPAEKIIAIYVAAPEGRQFEGRAIIAAAEAAGLAFGDMRIFHYYSESGAKPKPVFSMASMVEPGWFDLDAVDQFSSPGLALFMRLPGPLEGTKALDAMLAAADHLRRDLGGELLDSSRSVMSKQTIAHLREEVLDFCRKLRIPVQQTH